MKEILLIWIVALVIATASIGGTIAILQSIFG